jgi:hypothetical protein
MPGGRVVNFKGAGDCTLFASDVVVDSVVVRKENQAIPPKRTMATSTSQTVLDLEFALTSDCFG